MRLRTIGLMMLLLCIGVGQANAVIIVEPDDFGDKEDLAGKIPGLTLETWILDLSDTLQNDGTVSAVDSVYASTGSKSFGTWGYDPSWGNANRTVMKASFASGASQVWLDFASDNPGSSDSNAVLHAYDENHVQVGFMMVASVVQGVPVTLSVAAPDISYILATWDVDVSGLGASPFAETSAGVLDNLQFAPVPEPGSLAIWSLLGVMGLAIGWRRRRAS